MKIYLDAFLANNFGDDLFVDILLKRYPNHNFIAISNGIVYNRYSNLKVFSNSFFYRVMKKFKLDKLIANRCDLIVTIGGSMYIENTGVKQDFNLGKNKRYILGANFGPYKSELFKENVKELFKNTEDVCLRDLYSYNMFKELTNVRYAPDIIFGLDNENVKVTNRKRAIISVISCNYKFKENLNNFTDTYTEEKYEEKIIELIKYLQSKEYEICLMSFCKEQNDEEAIESILKKCDEDTKNRIEKYYYTGDIAEALNVIGDSRLIIGSRFHANIIGMVLGKTVIPMYYSDKTKNVIEDMNIDIKAVDIRDIQNFDINSINDEDLTRVIDVSGLKRDAKNQFNELDKVLLTR